MKWRELRHRIAGAIEVLRTGELSESWYDKYDDLFADLPPYHELSHITMRWNPEHHPEFPFDPESVWPEEKES